MTTTMAEWQALITSHPWAWVAGGTAVVLLGLVIFVWRLKLSFGVSAAGKLGFGGHFEAWGRLGFVGMVLVRDVDGRRHRAITIGGQRWFDRTVTSKKKRPAKARSQRSKPKRGASGFDWFRFVRRHWSLWKLARFAWQRRVDFRFHALSGHVEVGFEEPNHTGEFYGAFCALTPLVPSLSTRDDGAIQAGDLCLSPDWSLEDHIAGNLRVGMDIRIIRLAFMTLWFLLTRWHRAPRPRRQGRRAWSLAS